MSSTALGHYGPWGYLMLGMLICGTVLMFCGLWECCFRRPKPEELQAIQPPTTVLIINQQQDDVASPPNYEDMDQPPTYSTLFPNIKLEMLEGHGQISRRVDNTEGRGGEQQAMAANSNENSEEGESRT